MTLTVERLKELLLYDPITGDFYWISGKTKNKKAGTISSEYVHIGVDRKVRNAHRLAWLYMTGIWPTNHIDHIDRNKKNNSWANLRLATRKQNAQNISAANVNNVSGYRGVTWCKRATAWRARIRVDGKLIDLGLFSDRHEAHTKYVAAKRQLHEFAPL